MPTIAGQNVSKAAANAIVSKAMELADEKDYCEEVESFLEELGFVIPDVTKTVTLQVEVSGRGRVPDLEDTYNWNVYHDSGETDNLKVVSVQ
jgi:hypothetical protein